MIIKKIAVGNSTEAFVEDGFTDGLNIISSDDNNKIISRNLQPSKIKAF